MKIVIFSGAGLSAESGISTFRDSNGLWNNHDIKKVCNINTWEKNYELIHTFYNNRRNQLAEVEPNEAHKIISKIQKEHENVILITQNVDDLLERAGCENVIHVHGILDEIKCPVCKEIYKMNYKSLDYENFVCKNCENTKLKPNIIFFDEMAPEYHWMYRHFESLKENDIVIVIGTDGSVVKIDDILTKRYNGYSYTGVNAKKILVNLNESIHINPKNFNYVYMENATSGMKKVYELLKTI
jgi:NAD-dependent deacetylase